MINVVLEWIGTSWYGARAVLRRGSAFQPLSLLSRLKAALSIKLDASISIPSRLKPLLRLQPRQLTGISLAHHDIAHHGQDGLMAQIAS